MADDLLTISDLIADAFDLADNQVTDLNQRTPLVSALPLIGSSNGTVHSWTKEVQAPVIGFRAPNVGRDHDHGVDLKVNAELAILDWAWTCDKAVANAWRKGRVDFLERGTLRHFRSALVGFENQLINGKLAAESGGFEGFRDAATIDGLDDNMVVNAGGTGAACTSVYAITTGEDDVVGVYKGDGTAIEPGETNTQQLRDANDKPYTGYVTDGQAWLGLQVASAFSIGRIANINAANPLTDELIYELLSKFPEGREPNLMIGNKVSREMLRKSRTATTTTGVPAPIPDSVAGASFIVSPAVRNNEAALT